MTYSLNWGSPEEQNQSVIYPTVCIYIYMYTHTTYISFYFIYSFIFILINIIFYMEKMIYVKESTPTIVRTGESEICRAGWPAENSGSNWCCHLETSFFFRKHQSLLLRFLTNWMRPIHIIEGNLFCLKSTDLNVNHMSKKLPSQRHPDWYLTKLLWTIALPSGRIKLTITFVIECTPYTMLMKVCYSCTSDP